MSLRLRCSNKKLKDIVSESSVKTRDIHKKVSKKRADNRSNINSECPDFSGALEQSSLGDAASFGEKGRQDGIKRVNWFCVQGWFVGAISRSNKDWLVVEKDCDEESQTGWAWAEKGCAHRLLKHYGPEIVESTVNWFVENWQAMKDGSGGRLYGAPTVKFLWASREWIFPAAKEGSSYAVKAKPVKKKKHMVGEYDAESASKRPRVGW